MGVARTLTGLMVGARRQVWSLVGARDVARDVAPTGKYDVYFITRHSFHTGPVMGHEMAWGKNQLCFVNTRFNCLGVLHPDFNFVRRWLPRSSRSWPPRTGAT